MSEIEESGTEELDVNSLVKENQILSENLSKCMEEKNFVWSLWKKLQIEKPDLSSVVSLVMAREKEKNEVRDAKVLNILETKDSQIQQLEKDKTVLDGELKQKNDDLKDYGLRLHDLLIEKAELQESLESVKNESEEKMKTLLKENAYLSEVVRARQVKLENDENAYKMKLNDVDRENQELHNIVNDLEHRVDKLNEEKHVKTAMIEENRNLLNRLDDLHDQLTSVRQERDDSVTTLRLRERQLQEHSNVNQEQKHLLNEKEQVILDLRQELNELKLVHSQCGVYAKEQSSLIQNLQSLQDQTQTIMKAQEEKFKSQVIDLKEQLRDSSKRRETLEADIEQSKLQGCEACTALKEELQTLRNHNEALLETAQERNRRVASLERALVAENGGKHGNSPSKTLERKCKSGEQKIFELQKLLEFKQNKVDALNSAHANRLQRYKNLQQEYKIVLKQLKTFENSSDEEKKREVEPIPRASPRSLQKEDCDSVWNELKYFKTEYEKLRDERDGIMEEIDVLRAEHANDVTTIQELRMCLEDEKRDLVEQIKVNNAQENEAMKKQNELLQIEKNDLKIEMESVRHSCSVTEEEKEALGKNLREQKELVERLTGEISKYKKEIRMAKAKKKKEKNEDETSKQDGVQSLVEEQKKSTVTDKQVQTDATLEKQLHEATKQLIFDVNREHFRSKTNQRDAQTSPIRTFGESSNSQVRIAPADLTAEIDESLAARDECDNKNSGDEMSREFKNRLASETPIKAARSARVKVNTPVRREWKSMRHRVLGLTQQVAALKTTKDFLTNSLSEQKLSNEKLQNDLSQCQVRAKVSKQTIERLNKELEESQRQNQVLMKNSRDNKIPSYPTGKHLEDRLKLSANECSRLSHELKSARKTNEDLEAKLKFIREKNSRHEHTLSQKKIFVEEMRSRLKVSLENLESTQASLKEAEEKVRQMVEKDNQQKHQMNSLKQRLEMEVQQKKNMNRLYAQSQENLKKKTNLLSQAQILRHEAEVAVSEMEEAANTQLHNLANHSQATLTAIEQQLNGSKRRLDEFQFLIKTLAQRLTEQITSKRVKMKQMRLQRFEDEKKTASMVQACELASSILNMSKADINEILDVDENENDEVLEWSTNVDELLAKEESFATPLLRLLLDIVENLVLLERRIDENDIR